MPVVTSRTAENAVVRIDHDKCAVCGLCARVCKAGPLEVREGRVYADVARGMGCVACGHCAAVCPNECITVEGRDLSSEDIVPLPSRELRATYDELHALLLARRSTREFDKREVEEDVIQQILDTSATAPMGIPPSDVHVLVLRGRDKVQEFKRDILGAMKSMQKMFSPAMLHVWRPIMGKETTEMFRTFLMPLVGMMLDADRRGEDLLTYDAPLAMLFYGTPYSDAVDSVIAATYSTIAAEALGLGSCMLGFPAPILKRNRKLAAKYGLMPKANPGLMVIYGYPTVTFSRAVMRRFAGVHYR